MPALCTVRLPLSSPSLRLRQVSRSVPMAAARTALAETGTSGEFKRTESQFRNWISAEEGAEFPAEAGRYHLYISYACPWACRCAATLFLKGLEEVIGLSVVHPTWQRTRPEQDDHTGWVFRSPDDPPIPSSTGMGKFSCEDCIPDTVNSLTSVRELYEKSNDTHGKYSVPVLWDKKLGVIVNNESSEVMRMFNSEFNHLAKNPDLNLRPDNLIDAIEEANSWVYPTINDGVYRCGFAKSQEAYENAFQKLFESLDKVEVILSTQRYIAGNVFTEADIRLFVTLIRFDEVYVVYFKTNKNFIRDYPNILNYVRDVYQKPGMDKSVNINHIKTHYFTSHPALNHYAIIPVGSGLDIYKQEHDRDRFEA